MPPIRIPHTGMTDDIYWAAQHEDVRVLRPGIPGKPALTENEKLNIIQELLAKGRLIDGPIMLWGWGPRNVMLMRLRDGQSSVQAMGEDNTPAQHGQLVGGLIKVSLDTADYPPVDVPPVPETHIIVTNGIYVAPSQGAGVYGSYTGDPTADDQIVTKDGVQYQMHRTMGFAGKIRRWYSRVPPLNPPEDAAPPGPPPAIAGDEGSV